MKRQEARGHWKIGRRLMIAFFLAAVAATISSLAWPPERFANPRIVALLSPLVNLERLGYDATFAIRGPDHTAIDPRIVVLGVDDTDETDSKIAHQWPFPRRVHANVIRNLKKDGALLIVYDVLLTGPSTPEDDRLLDDAMKEAGNVVLTMRIEHATAVGRPMKSAQWPYSSPDKTISFEDHSVNGFADTPVDEDGIVRTMEPVASLQDEWTPSFAAAAYMRLNNIDPSALKVTPKTIDIGGLHVPRTGPTGSDAYDDTEVPLVRVNYPASVAFAPEASFAQVASGEAKAGAFKGKIVFVGLTGATLTKEQNERFTTAYGHFREEQISRSQKSHEIPGVVLQALHFNALLKQGYLREAPTYSVWAAVFLFTMTAVSLVRRFPNLLGLGLVMVCAGALFAYSLLSLKFSSVHVPWVVPDLFLLISAAGVGWLESGSIKKKWAGYVSPAVLAQILQTEGSLGAQRYDGSVMFGDIRGFTSFSEQHSPETVVFLLNRHLEKMTAVVAAENGTIDKFLGDGILAVFGAPIPFEQSAVAAVRAAWVMREAAQLPIKDEAGNEHVLSTGFGISTGPFLGGDIGSKQLRNWTVIGDVVNLASRLQGVTGVSDVIIDAPTYELVKDHVTVESLGAVTLKGKAQPVPCFRVTDWH